MSETNAVYLDSTLIAKFYLNEPGRDAVREFARQAGRVVCSAVAKAEVSAAFHRKIREGAIETETFKALQGQFSYDLKAGLWTLIPVTEFLLDDVQALFARMGPKVYLRSLDGLHAVSAKSEKLDRLYSNDRHLLAACPQIGLVGVNPIS